MDLPILEALQDIFAINRDRHFLGILKYCDSSESLAWMSQWKKTVRVFCYDLLFFL